jgi:hypothetical protein
MNSRRAVTLLVAVLVAAAALAVATIYERPAPHSPEQLVPTTWRFARETPMHVLHVGTKKLACSECHAATVTPGTAAVIPDGTCTKCHEAEAKLGHVRHSRGAGGAAVTACLSCHVFGANKTAARCNDCHARTHRMDGAPPLEHHASAELPCNACHSIHRAERAVLPDCTACHTNVSASHGAQAVHAPADAGATAQAMTTLSLDPAMLAYLREAGAPSSSFASDNGPMAPPNRRGALPGEICTACHAPHTGKEAARTRCEECHVEGRSGESAKASALASLAAKAPRVAPLSDAAAGHPACTTCHEPHRARRADVRACTTCHADHAAAASNEGHRACTICHDPHRPETPPGEACVRCHEDTKPSHPAVSPVTARAAQATRDPGATGPCIGCHRPHGAATSTLHAIPQDTAIATAHPETKTAKALSCTTCHTRLTDHAVHAKDLGCTDCHTPHEFALGGAGAAVCARCHGPTAAATAARPGHANCASCHGGAHAPVPKPSCRSCHAEEARTTPAGHSTCTSCHDAHSGGLGKRVSCTSCHEDKSKALHGSTPQGCASCHRPHGGSPGPRGSERPPACATCHARPSLQGLHAVSAHATCETCHAPHAPPRADRATCTSNCHADRRGHQQDAASCKGCHLFRQ